LRRFPFFHRGERSYHGGFKSTLGRGFFPPGAFPNRGDPLGVPRSPGSWGIRAFWGLLPREGPESAAGQRRHRGKNNTGNPWGLSAWFLKVPEDQRGLGSSQKSFSRITHWVLWERDIFPIGTDLSGIGPTREYNTGVQKGGVPPISGGQKAGGGTFPKFPPGKRDIKGGIFKPPGEKIHRAVAGDKPFLGREKIYTPGGGRGEAPSERANKNTGAEKKGRPCKKTLGERPKQRGGPTKGGRD